MALEGPLKEFHIQDVFQLLDLGRKSGVLRVTSELRQTAGTVSFDRGGVVAASLGSDPQPIGARLVRLGKISAEELEPGPRTCRTSGDARRLGDILVAIGAIAPARARPAAQGPGRGGRLRAAGLVRGLLPLRGRRAVRRRWSRRRSGFPTEALLMEAARRHGRVVPDRGQGAASAGWSRGCRRPTTAASDPLDLMPFEWEVLAAVDGERDLHALAARAGPVGVRCRPHGVRP